MARPVDADAAQPAREQIADLVVIVAVMAAAGQQDDRVTVSAGVVGDRTT